MIQTTNKNSLKDIREKRKQEEEQKLRDLCEKSAIDKFGESKLAAWRKEFGSLWFLPILKEDEVEKLAVMKPITRTALSYAASKLEDDGLYGFLESCMRECWIDGDNEILDDDEYFIPASMKFNKILEGKTAAFLKA